MVSIGTIIGGLTLLVGGIVGYSIYTNRDKISAVTENVLGGIETSVNSIGTRTTSLIENSIPAVEKITLPNPFSFLQAWATPAPQPRIAPGAGDYDEWLESGGERGNNQPNQDTEETENPSFIFPSAYADDTEETTQSAPPPQTQSLYQKIIGTYADYGGYESRTNAQQNTIIQPYLQQYNLDYSHVDSGYSEGLQNRLFENLARSKQVSV